MLSFEEACKWSKIKAHERVAKIDPKEVRRSMSIIQRWITVQALEGHTFVHDIWGRTRWTDTHGPKRRPNVFVREEVEKALRAQGYKVQPGEVDGMGMVIRWDEDD